MSRWHVIESRTYQKEVRMGDYVDRPIHLAARAVPGGLEVAWLTDPETETAPKSSIRLARFGEFDLDEQIGMLASVQNHVEKLRAILAETRGDG